MGFILAQKILKAHPNGFVGAIVEGKRGVGKSSYCIKVMKEVYKTIYDCDDEEGYRYALKHTVFDLDDVVRTLKESRRKDIMIPALLWDDAGIHGSSIQWFINMRGIQEMKAVMDTVRSATSGLLLTCPDREGLTKVLRGYNDFLITIAKIDTPYTRSARGYNIYKLPSGMKRVYKNFDDRYSCYLPNAVYDEYMIERHKCLDNALDAMEAMKNKMAKAKAKAI